MLAPARDGSSDDPRRLRLLLGRARELAVEHRVPSVIIGLAAPEGDLLFPELVRFVESALRIEDGVFRMTRERAVVVLSDANGEHAEQILERLLDEFKAQFPSAKERPIAVGFFEVPPGTQELLAKDVLPALFAQAFPPPTH